MTAVTRSSSRGTRTPRTKASPTGSSPAGTPNPASTSATPTSAASTTRTSGTRSSTWRPPPPTPTPSTPPTNTATAPTPNASPPPPARSSRRQRLRPPRRVGRRRAPAPRLREPASVRVKPLSVTNGMTCASLRVYELAASRFCCLIAILDSEPIWPAPGRVLSSRRRARRERVLLCAEIQRSRGSRA